MFRIALAHLLAIFVLQTGVFADSLQLPLLGYFHPGRAMPVQWDVSSSSPIELSADGAIASSVSSGDNHHGVFPWLVLSPSIKSARWQTSQISLYPLDESDRLVATTLADDSVASSLFPSRQNLVIRLDPARPLPGPPMAWETLDALVLDPQSISHIPLATRQFLLAAGVTLAVVSAEAPDTQFPWVKTGQVWAVRSGLAIPPSINPQAFDPILGWPAGRSPAFRRRIVQLAIIFSLLAGGIALWKSPRMPLAMAAFCLVAIGALTLDNRTQSSIARATGTIYVDAKSVAVADQWIYQSSHRDAPFTLSVSGLIHPVAADLSELNPGDMTLTCNQSGEPVSIGGKLRADHPLALLIRQLSPAFEPQSTATDSPLRKLIQESIYPDCTLMGQSPAQGGAADQTTHWPSLVARMTSPQ